MPAARLKCGCGRDVSARGMCRRCYEKWRRRQRGQVTQPTAAALPTSGWPAFVPRPKTQRARAAQHKHQPVGPCRHCGAPPIYRDCSRRLHGGR